MKQQLICTFLGENRTGLLCQLAKAVNEAGCNILDSRQANFGTDFSLTMIIEGHHPEITKAELLLPTLSNELELLSLLKRTKAHSKQNIEHLLSLEFSGPDTTGLLEKVSVFLSQHAASINALRQKSTSVNDIENVRCKIVINIPDDVDVAVFSATTKAFFDSLSLTCTITDKHHINWSE
jgi:glycine cleavage system transcriptional repressor